MLSLFSAESQLTTTPRSTIGRPNVKSPWLNPSSPNAFLEPKTGGGTEIAVISSSSSPTKDILGGSSIEDPLAPELVPYVGSNQSTQYMSSSSGFHGNVQPELDGSSVIVLTSSTTPTPPPSTSSTSAVRSEVSPIQPPAANDESRGGGNRRKDEGGAYDRDFPKSWGEGSEVTETSYRDWVERERPLEESDPGFSNMDVKWSDRMPESEVTQRPPIFPTQNSHHGSRNGHEEEQTNRAGVYRPTSGK